MSLLKNDPNPSMFEEAEPKKKKNRRMISRSPKVRTPTPTYVVDSSRTTPDPRASPFSPRGAGASKKSSPVNRDLFIPAIKQKSLVVRPDQAFGSDEFCEQAIYFT